MPEKLIDEEDYGGLLSALTYKLDSILLAEEKRPEKSSFRRAIWELNKLYERSDIGQSIDKAISIFESWPCLRFLSEVYTRNARAIQSKDLRTESARFSRNDFMKIDQTFCTRLESIDPNAILALRYPPLWHWLIELGHVDLVRRWIDQWMTDDLSLIQFLDAVYSPKEETRVREIYSSDHYLPRLRQIVDNTNDLDIRFKAEDWINELSYTPMTIG